MDNQSIVNNQSVENQIVCPQCGSTNVRVEVQQENQGSVTTQKTKSKYKEDRRHGCLWWFFIGSWWWIIDLFIWIFAFIPRLLIHVGRKKKYTSTSTSVAKTKNIITYKTVCVCQNCGHNWVK